MYAIASTAKAKLGTEVDRPDHRLRILVGHANLLDVLMEELVDAEHKLQVALRDHKARCSVVHVRWIDQIPEDDTSEEEQDSDASDEDADLVELVLQRSR